MSAAALGRCPACGRSGIYKGFLTLKPTCESCGLDLRGQDSGDGAVAFIVLIVGFVVVGAALVVEVKYGWPIWLHMLVWLPAVVVGCLVLMRPVKSLLVAMQYRHRPDTLARTEGQDGHGDDGQH